MTREEAIRILNESRRDLLKASFWEETRMNINESFDMAIEALEAQRWIPVSEGLPEESGTYIVTAYDGISRRTTFVKYQKRLNQWNLSGARSYWRILAWMPLSEPYKEGEKNEAD